MAGATFIRRGPTRRRRGRKSGTAIAIALAIVACLLASAPHRADAADGSVTSSFDGLVDAATSPTAVHHLNVDAVGTMTVSLDWNDPTADLNLFVKDPSGTQV